ncbi:MAG: 50S ribosomal protein L4 [Patescibacteria group bacterium]
MKTTLFNQKGENIGKIDVPEEFFSVQPDFDLLHQVVVFYESLSRESIAKSKDRSEVRGGGKKPWRQKGTGKARHGSIRSPIWKGGGVTFGPRPGKKYQVKMSQREKRKALPMVLSQKLRDNEIVFLDKVEVKTPKTKEVKEMIGRFEKRLKDIGNKKVAFVLRKKDEKFERAARNIKNVSLVAINSLNPYILLKNKYLFIEKSVLEGLKI